MDAQLIEDAIKGFIFGVILVTALIVGVVTFSVTRYLTPTPETVEKAKQRQAVIEQLTPEQRKALGL